MLYLDTSAFVPVFVREARSALVKRALASHTGAIVISDWAVAEAESAIALRVRMRTLSAKAADAARARMERSVSAYQREPIERQDFLDAAALIRGTPSPLRAADALHLAACKRLSAELLTLDMEMATAARVIGIAVVPI